MARFSASIDDDFEAQLSSIPCDRL
ncbi:hypothetical protein [Desulfonema limicola]